MLSCAWLGVCLSLLLVASADGALTQDASTATAPDLELSVYGSGSFRQGGLSVGDFPMVEEKGMQRLLVSGGQSELSFHDRHQASCTAKNRWNLYATEKKLRTHRPEGQGGFEIREDMTKFLQDLNIGGKIDVKTLALSGVGERTSDSVEGEPVLIGMKQLHHLKLGYGTGHSWIQSVKSHLSINPSKEKLLVGMTVSKGEQKLQVGGGHLRVEGKLTVGGSDGKAFLSETHMQFALGGGWSMTEPNYLKSINNLPAYTKGGGKFMGNVGVGTLPKFPIFRLQVHQSAMSDHGAVMVTDKADRGLTLAQTKEGALLRSWNIDTKKHEAMLVEAGPLLVQPRSGVVLFGTTVRKKRMHLHIKGNLYIHGHMFAMKNLHVKDHANLKHLLMPSIALKNKPQSADGDTLVMGHMKKAKKENTEPGPWETPGEKKVITGVNMRFGFHTDYTWIQVHGKDKGKHKPLAINPLGNTVAIGIEKVDRKYSLHANGNGYVLGTLYVKVQGTRGQQESGRRLLDAAPAENDVTHPSHDDAMEDLRGMKVQRSLVPKTEGAQEQMDKMLRSRLSLISVPARLSPTATSGDSHVSVSHLTSMVHKVLRKQESHMALQDATLKRQADTIARLQAVVAARKL